jgi:hypothetical protein
MADKDIIAEAKDAFDDAADHESENRLAALDDIRFARLGDQWDRKIRQQRELDGRPCLTFNKLPAFIRQVVNDARQNRPQITTHPADSYADPETSEVVNGLIRNIQVTSNADVAYDTALDHAVTGGFGYFRINLAYASDDTFDQDIRIERIANPFSVYGDPCSTSADSADWNKAFVVDKIEKDAFAKRYKGAQAVDWEALGYNDLSEAWRDGDDIQIAEYWKREEVSRQILALSNGEVVGADEYKANKALFDQLQITVVGRPRDVASHKVTQYILTGAEVLETVAWKGRYIPMVPVYGDEVNVEGKRHLRSLIRDAKDPQRMYNYWRTTTTELVALAPRAPFLGPKGAFKTDADKWATANTENHAFIEYDGPTEPQRQPFAGPPAGALQEALNASDDMKAIIGLYDPSLGARSNETSGRAIIARQKEGDISTFHFIDNLSRSIRHAGRIILDLLPEVYSAQRIVRVMGEDGTTKPVAVGSPQGDDNMPAQPPEGFERVYDIALGKYDLTVEAGPSFSTQREEAASQMIELIRAYPQAAPVIGDLLAKNLDWPGADEIAKRLQAISPAAQQGDPQHEQMMQQASQAVGQLQQQLAQMSQALQQAQSDNELKSRELDIKAYEAETKRMDAATKARQPSHLPAQPSAANS